MNSNQDTTEAYYLKPFFSSHTRTAARIKLLVRSRVQVWSAGGSAICSDGDGAFSA